MIEYNGKVFAENSSLNVYRETNDKIYIKLNDQIFEFSGKMLSFYKKLIDNEIFSIDDGFESVLNILINSRIINKVVSPNTYTFNKHIYFFNYLKNDYCLNVEQGKIYCISNIEIPQFSDEAINKLNNNLKYELRCREIIVPEERFKANNMDEIRSHKRVYLINSFQCNMHCTYCFETSKSANVMIEDIKEKTKKFLYDLTIHNSLSIVFYGGEPLLNENWEFIKEFLSLQLDNTKYEIITNGLGIDTYLNMFLTYKKQISCFTITVDGPKYIHDKRRLFKNGSYDKIMNNIELLLKSEFFIKIRVNLDYENIEYLSELLDDIESNLKEYNKYFLIDLHLVSCKSDTDFKQLKLIDFADKVLSLRRYSFKINVAEQLLKRLFDSASVFATNYIQKDFCNYYDNIIINNNGDIYHCNEAMGMENFKIANIFDENIYDKIGYVESLDKGICQDCPFDIVCKGKCKYENFIKKGSSDLVTCNKEEMLEVIKYMIDKGEYDTINDVLC